MNPSRCEAELRQDRCFHVLKHIDAKTAAQLRPPDYALHWHRDYKYECLKCGKLLKVKSGVLRP